MLSGWGKGTVVGFLDLVVVAFAMAVYIDEAPLLDVFGSVVLVGFLPATLCGMLVGHCAAQARLQNRRVVLLAMISFACSCVALIGDAMDLHAFIPYACVPTAAACAVLERWTRSRVDAIPIARVA
jgi:hypothetical protein